MFPRKVWRNYSWRCIFRKLHRQLFHNQTEPYQGTFPWNQIWKLNSSYSKMKEDRTCSKKGCINSYKIWLLIDWCSLLGTSFKTWQDMITTWPKENTLQPFSDLSIPITNSLSSLRLSFPTKKALAWSKSKCLFDPVLNQSSKFLTRHHFFYYYFPRGQWHPYICKP